MRRRFLLFFAFFLLAAALSVFADSNGNIRVEITRMESSFPYLVLVGVAAGLLVVLIISVALLAWRRRSPRSADSVPSVALKEEHAFRSREYYDAVLARPSVTNSGKKVHPHSSYSADSDGAAGSAVDAGQGSVDRYLKEDERIVINVLRMRHNSCSQATLRVVTDFSKARLSRILSELEARGVVFKEPRGRKNIITLRE